MRNEQAGRRPARSAAALALILGLTGLLGGCSRLGQEPSYAPLLPVQFASKTEPPSLDELKTLPVTYTEQSLDELPPLLAEALRETALSLGAQAGLAWRSREINGLLDRFEGELSRNFPFDQLVIRAPNGAIVEPPVVTEAADNFAVAEDGQAATRIDRVYRIVAPARLITSVRNWRDYLVRTWEVPEAPVATLLPKTAAERQIWEEAIEEGWKSGFLQADEIFEYDLNRMERDLQGMVRYRALVSHGVISEIYFSAADRGITGGGDELRIGDRSVRIAAPASLTPASEVWTPVVIPVPLDFALPPGPRAPDALHALPLYEK